MTISRWKYQGGNKRTDAILNLDLATSLLNPIIPSIQPSIRPAKTMATTQIPGVPTTIRYSPHADAVTGHSEEYKLLEISDELLRQVDAADSRGENLR
jgi:hypothetical protein